MLCYLISETMISITAHQPPNSIHYIFYSQFYMLSFGNATMLSLRFSYFLPSVTDIFMMLITLNNKNIRLLLHSQMLFRELFNLSYNQERIKLHFFPYLPVEKGELYDYSNLEFRKLKSTIV